MGSIRGKVVDGADEKGDIHYDAAGPPLVLVRLLRADGSGTVETKADRAGDFEFQDVAPGWYILESERGSMKPIHVGAEAFTDAGTITLPPRTFGFFEDFQKPQGVFTVCEALDKRESLRGKLVVVVGIFKSGMDETLRLDCPTQLVLGEMGWPSAIGLTDPSMPPESLRGEVEKKRQEILSSALPQAQPRPERVVGLYGRFASLVGLSSAKCCSSTVETTLPPARLSGDGSADLPLIR